MDALLWLVLEAAVALALLIAIVWWTWPKKRSHEDDTPPRPPV